MDPLPEGPVSPQATVVTPPAEVDASNAGQFAQELSCAVKSGGMAVVVDLSRTGFIDGTGIDVLRAASGHAASGGLELCLVAPSAAVARALVVAEADSALAIYPTLAAAFRAIALAGRSSDGGPDVPGQDVSEGYRSADIVELIVSDHRRIRGLQSTVRDAVQNRPGIGRSAWVLGIIWTRLARLIDLHLSAEDEICVLTFYDTDPSGLEQMRDLIADHDDIRYAIQETSLHPAGSATWWRPARDALRACEECFRQEEEHTLPKFARWADDGRRYRLGRQWEAYMTAHIRDRGRPGWR